MPEMIVQEAGPLAPSRVRQGVSRAAEVLEPFQYYSEVEELIYALEFNTHMGTARHYLHYAANGDLEADLLVSDDVLPDKIAGQLRRFDEAMLDQVVAEEADFFDLLAEMHFLASQQEELLFQPRQMDVLQTASPQDPVLIGGCGRSGTTLLLSVLGAHPSILAFPDELYAFYPRPFRLGRIINGLEELGAGRDWQRWCEKTPKNVRAFDDIWNAFDGQVHLIHMVRDGRDVVTSHHPNAEERYYIAAERWVADVCAGLQHADKCMLVHYEDLVGQPEDTLRRICKYIGEEFDARMLNYEQHSTVLENKAWEGRAAKALHQGQVERWRASEHSERVKAFMQTDHAAELMTELGYL